MSAHRNFIFVAAAVALALAGAGITAVPANAVVPLSASLDKCIQDTLDANPGSTEQDIAGIDCTQFNDPISSLAGIQNFPQLVSLTFDGAADADGDLSPLGTLVSLEDLAIHDFHITNTAPLHPLTMLDTVDLSHNDLADVAPGFPSQFLTSINFSYNNFSDASSIAAISGGLSEVYVAGNHLTNLEPLNSCEVYDATGQTLAAPLATAGVAIAIPTLTDGNGNPVDDIRVADNSAVAGTVNAGSVTWAGAGAGTLSWDYTFQSTDCGGTGHYAGTITQQVNPGAGHPAPTVTGVAPATGSINGGASVTITGTGLQDATAVSFGSSHATFSVLSNTSISATAPFASAAGPVDVTVTTPDGMSATGPADQFTYLTPPPPPPVQPLVTSLTPDSGSTAGGTSLTISGSGFMGATAVHFGAASASFTVVDDGTIDATAPAGLPGTVDVTVTTPVGSSVVSSADRFAYIVPMPAAPMVTFVSPSTGPQAGGTTVTLSGTDLGGASAVLFGSTPATTFTVESDTNITVSAPPASAPGPVDISVTTPAGTSGITGADVFTYSPPPAAPTISSVNPASGSTAGGTSVAITGTGLTNATSVTFDGIDALSFSVNSDTSIVAVTPAHAAGTVNVNVATPAGAGPGWGDFTYVTPAAPNAPILIDPRTGHPTTTYRPNSGTQLGGTAIGLRGLKLYPAVSVTVGGISVPFTGRTLAGGRGPTESQLFFTTPGSATPGVVPIVITTLAGTLTLNFTYLPVSSPTLTGPKGGPTNAYRPNSGTQLGGTAIGLRGLNLYPALSVTVGGISVPFTGRLLAAAQGPTESELFFTTPGSAVAGDVPVVVTTLGGSLTLKYTYTAAGLPRLTGPKGESTHTYRPNSGTQLGGTAIGLRGESLYPAVSVTVGGVSVPFTGKTLPAAGDPAQSELFFTTPGSATTGVVPIVITTLAGSLTLTYTYTAAGSPTLTGPKGEATHSYRPNSGTQLGGTAIGLRGESLYPAVSVTVGGVSVPFTGKTLPAAGDPAQSELFFTTPGSATTGVVPIVITTLAGTLTLNFAYLPVSSPTMTGPKGGPTNAYRPNSGTQLGGTAIGLRGLNLYPALSVTVGGVSVPFTGRVLAAGTGPTESELFFTTPGSATPGVVPIVITTQAGTLTLNFTYLAVSSPTLTGPRGGPTNSYRPNSGTQLGGTAIGLRGLNLYPALSVTVGGVSVPFTGRVLAAGTGPTESELFFTTPGSATTGTVPIVITTLAGKVTLTFTYQ